MFLTVSLAKSKGQSLKYATSMQTGCKDLGKFQFEAIVQLLQKNIHIYSANLSLINIVLDQRNRVFSKNFDFPIPISLQTNVVDLRYFKL